MLIKYTKIRSLQKIEDNIDKILYCIVEDEFKRNYFDEYRSLNIFKNWCEKRCRGNVLYNSIHPVLIFTDVNDLILFKLELLNTTIEENPIDLKLNIVKQVVTAKTRKLSARWAYEPEKDISYHGIDVEAEIMAALSQNITAEIDNEILTGLLWDNKLKNILMKNMEFTK